ncbi:MAG: uncharacterized protein KVP18_003423 [Porospora cf. gigantea A]|uniref:uncharacterized protein n=1 Tax=Porospora cf. gigantea A TaxID=2853593 RepID=UPI00355A9F13|nr:MAG: hypothetical protein KVP18_003423 [Porospora cf. gigantea A]
MPAVTVFGNRRNEFAIRNLSRERDELKRALEQKESEVEELARLKTELELRLEVGQRDMEDLEEVMACDLCLARQDNITADMAVEQKKQAVADKTKALQTAKVDAEVESASVVRLERSAEQLQNEIRALQYVLSESNDKNDKAQEMLTTLRPLLVAAADREVQLAGEVDMELTGLAKLSMEVAKHSNQAPRTLALLFYPLGGPKSTVRVAVPGPAGQELIDEGRSKSVGEYVSRQVELWSPPSYSEAGVTMRLGEAVAAFDDVIDHGYPCLTSLLLTDWANVGIENSSVLRHLPLDASNHQRVNAEAHSLLGRSLRSLLVLIQPPEHMSMSLVWGSRRTVPCRRACPPPIVEGSARTRRSRLSVLGGTETELVESCVNPSLPYCDCCHTPGVLESLTQTASATFWHWSEADQPGSASSALEGDTQPRRQHRDDGFFKHASGLLQGKTHSDIQQMLQEFDTGTPVRISRQQTDHGPFAVEAGTFRSTAASLTESLRENRPYDLVKVNVGSRTLYIAAVYQSGPEWASQAGNVLQVARTIDVSERALFSALGRSEGLDDPRHLATTVVGVLSCPTATHEDASTIAMMSL